MRTRRLTMAQALVSFLKNQYVERDGQESRFFAGAWGIFGHGIIAGLGQGLQQNPDFPYYLCRNEQGAVHIATAFAKARNRKATFVCTSSIGPGATNMITGAATATVNRIPVLLLPGDIFARRNVAPVLQQLESEHSQDVSVNDAFKPVSRYWDRINRPDQLPCSVVEAMRVLTSPAQTGAVTLALPQDVQSEAWDYPAEMFEKRVWHVARPGPEPAVLARAAAMIRAAKRPLIVAGGGVIYSEATAALSQLASHTGIPVGESQAGKGSLPFDHSQNLGAMGVTGTPGANIAARDADLVIAIGTRMSDFTTASKTAFQNPNVHFVNINVNETDAHKHGGLPVIADAQAALIELDAALAGYHVDQEYATSIAQWKQRWEDETDRLFALRHGPPDSQGEVIGVVNRVSRPQDVVVCAAGSLPGDLHKLWRTQDPKGYHVEYGYSTMGYEIAGGLGVKMADPGREVYVMVGDGSYLMMAQEIVTSIQERMKLTVVLVDNQGFASIGALSRSKGTEGFGTRYRHRTDGSLGDDSGRHEGEALPVDLALNAEGLGAHVIRARNVDELRDALVAAKAVESTVVIHIPTDRYQGVPDYESWWEVPVAEVSKMPEVDKARREHERGAKRRRWYL